MKRALLLAAVLLLCATSAVAAAFTNFSYAGIATAPTPATSGTSLVVTAGKGALFPAPPFQAVVWQQYSQPLATNAEVVTVTVVSTDTFTIVRAREGSTARSIITGDQIAATITAQVLSAFATSAGTVALQASTPGTQQTGNANLSGSMIAGAFSGPLTGNVTGNASGSAGTVTSIASHASTELSDTAGLARLASPAFTGVISVSGGTKTVYLNPYFGSIGPAVQVGSADPLLFVTGNLERARIDPSGNFDVDSPTFVVDATNHRVGIGTTTPIYPFHISDGYVKTDTTFRDTSFQASNEPAAGQPFGLLTSVRGAAATTDRTVQLQTVNFGVSFTGNLTLQPLGGNVGIGTTTPLAKLAINGGVHVGGDSDPGDNNLLVDGTATVNAGLKINGDGGGSKPSCAAGIRGTFWYVAAAAGVADTAEICTKDAANAYAWRAIY